MVCLLSITCVRHALQTGQSIWESLIKKLEFALCNSCVGHAISSTRWVLQEFIERLDLLAPTVTARWCVHWHANWASTALIPHSVQSSLHGLRRLPSWACTSTTLLRLSRSVKMKAKSTNPHRRSRRLMVMALAMACQFPHLQWMARIFRPKAL